jgi:hypothetical protein
MPPEPASRSISNRSATTSPACIPHSRRRPRARIVIQTGAKRQVGEARELL